MEEVIKILERSGSYKTKNSKFSIISFSMILVNLTSFLYSAGIHEGS